MNLTYNNESRDTSGIEFVAEDPQGKELLISEKQPMLYSEMDSKKSLFHYRWRWYSLGLITFMMTGPYYAYDNPAELEDQIETLFDISQSKYSLLYSFYALPNMVLPILGGMAIDKVGKDIGLVVCTFLISAGTIIISLGGYLTNFNLMLFGRTFYGLGGETMYVVNMLYLCEWFYDYEYSFASGIVGAIDNSFAALSGYLVPKLYDDYGIGLTLGFAAFMCVFSSFTNIFMIILDRKACKVDKAKKERLDGSMVETMSFKFSDLKTLSVGFWLLIADCMVTYGT